MKDGIKKKRVKIDLHCHSTCSDGTNTPKELIQLAAAANIDVLALTDHDTLSGLDIARKEAQECDIRLINGVEISCEHTLLGGYGKHKSKDKIIHVLGLDFDDFETMNNALENIQASRADRGRAIVHKLATLIEHDFDHLWKAVLKKADGNAKAVGRSHIAKVLYELGVVKTMQQAFDKYLGDNKSAYVAIEALSMQETITLIHQCGGKAVLAHATRYQLSATRVRRLIREFAELGGDACELPSSDEQISTRKMVDRSINEHNLKVSVGSDFHGTTMPWRRLGDVPHIDTEQTLILESLLKA